MIKNNQYSFIKIESNKGKKMKIKTKSNILIVILSLATIMGFLTLIVGTAYADDNESPIFIISPSGRDDTANIQAAFDAAIAAGLGSTVQLTSGQFYTNNIFVQN
ncbi:MAG: hypothetical protein ACFFC1_14350 [Promethearchaeota archaeon]